MRISSLAAHAGTTPHTIRFYEQHGFLPAARRGENHYRDYTDSDVERLRLLLGLRQLDLPLEQAAQLASMCAEGRCGQVSSDLRAAIVDKRIELRCRIREMRYLDGRLAHLQKGLSAGDAPRSLITLGKEERDDVM